MVSKVYEDNLRRAIDKYDPEIITFEADGKEFKIPKLLLMAQSEYFATKFNTDMKDSKENVIHVDCFASDVIEKLLAFFFVPQTSIGNSKLALGLFKASNYYQIAHVKLAIVDYFVNNQNVLTNDILMSLFSEAELQNSKEVMKVVLEHILSNDIDVTTLADYDKVTHSQLTIIMKAQIIYQKTLSQQFNSALYRMNISTQNIQKLRWPTYGKRQAQPETCLTCPSYSNIVKPSVNLSSLFNL